MRRAPVAVLAGLATLAVAAPASAHTEPDLVAVPAGTESTVTLKPTHGCGESPTVVVRIRAPMEGATAGAVEGWTAAATPDGDGRTVLEWTGGALPADQDGAFPVTFLAPATPGELLTFPAIQVCENGEELAWISGDPQDEYPAPRVLVLPPGSEPAETIDDVPLDAPGRDQLVAVVDVDNPAATIVPAPPTTTAPVTTAPAPVTTAAASPATTIPTPTSTTEPTVSTPPSTVTETTATADDEGGSGAAVAVGAAAVATVAVGGGAIALARRRNGS